MSQIESSLRYREDMVFILSLLLALCCSSPIAADVVRERDLEIVGWLEHVRLPDVGILLKAKLDTGAETSSLDVDVLKKFRKGDKSWVRFRMIDRESGVEHIVVRERIRTVSIVKHDGERQSRPVVNMRICIAGRILNTEVSLVDRSEFAYPMLLGRKSLESFALVDPGSTYLSTAGCGSSFENWSSGN